MGVLLGQKKVAIGRVPLYSFNGSRVCEEVERENCMEPQAACYKIGSNQGQSPTEDMTD